jgi:hypothetical protein
MTRSTLFLAAAAVCMISAVAQAETVKFHATLNGASEVPPKSTGGTGSVDASLNTATKVLTYTLTYTGLSGPATAAHFHGPAPVGANAGVLVPLNPPLASPVKGTATLTDAQVTALEGGNVYANVHTAANPGGEIRGQLTK